MKKRFACFLCLLLLCLSLPAYAGAATARLSDGADYLTDSEEAELLGKLDEISSRQGLDVVIVTIPDLYGEDITAFADNYYDENGFSEDGILLLISDYDREWAISTAGYGITAFTDAGQEYLTGQFLDELSDGEYAAAFGIYAEQCDQFITQARAGEPYDVGNLPKGPFPAVRNLAVSLVIGLVAALIATGSMKGKLKTVHAQSAASQYVKPGSLDITESRDLFLYRQLSRQKRAEQKSGGSSTHTSSSGRTHGGSKGKF